MRSLLNSDIKILRNGYGHKEGTKIVKHMLLTVYESIPGRVTSGKLFILYQDENKIVYDIRKNDIIEDSLTGFQYTIIEHPILGGGKAHHWEAKVERYIDGNSD